MFTLIDERVSSARSGTNPYVICRVRSGWVVLGDSQFFLGYSLLLPDPVAHSLNSLTLRNRRQILEDMAAVGDALLACTDAYRINYEILGNHDQALHAHIFPRRTTEPEDSRVQPVWLYPKGKRSSPSFDAHTHGALQQDLRSFLLSVDCALPFQFQT
jgi:diadenosine tetraphosphate (Ap4A) HIT family hydrolase